MAKPRRWVDFPEDLKREAKKAALDDGKPFYQWVFDVVQQELERRKQKKEKQHEQEGG